MAKLILKVNYFKPGRAKSMGGYAQYIATREGVEKLGDDTLLLKSSENQEQFIEKLVKDFPSSVHTDEYKSYQENPTVGNASAFITSAVEDNLPSFMDSPTYADYIATRPRAERIGSHGLFTSGDEPIVLSKVSEELNSHSGNVWTMIASLHRDDATRLGFDNAKRWKDMIGSKVSEVAKNMNIPLDRLKWYGAFHDEGDHPHVHIIVYSTEPKEGFISKKGIDSLRSAFAKEIFAQDLESIYENQTELRNDLKDAAEEALRELFAQAEEKNFESEAIEQKLMLLSEKLRQTKGKRVYGYLSKDIKDIVDSIVDELAKDETVSELYDRWYEKKYEILGLYSSKRPPKIPLSENQEFKSIKNFIIREALHLIHERIPNNQPQGTRRWSGSNRTGASHSNNSGSQSQSGTHAQHHSTSYTPTPKVTAVAVTRLFKNLCGIFRDRLEDPRRRNDPDQYVDRRLRREDEAKRNAEMLYDY